MLTQIKALMDMPNTDESLLTEKLKTVFKENGYQTLFGKTQGYYGPYVWRDTIPTVYNVELPNGTAGYTVNVPAELEYRAKLVELRYSSDSSLLQKFLAEADESRERDSHAVASAQIKRDFAYVDQTDISFIQARALELFNIHTKRMKKKYGERK